jgi:hypothetical protein
MGIVCNGAGMPMNGPKGEAYTPARTGDNPYGHGPVSMAPDSSMGKRASPKRGDLGANFA